LRQAASILLRGGIGATALESIFDLVKPDHAEIVIQFLLDRNGGKSSSQIVVMMAHF